MKPIQERIHLYKDGELVTFASLTEEEKKIVRTNVTTRLMDAMMESKGYIRVGKEKSDTPALD